MTTYQKDTKITELSFEQAEGCLCSGKVKVKSHIVHGCVYYYVYCRHCGRLSDVCESSKDAIRKWNKKQELIRMFPKLKIR